MIQERTELVEKHWHLKLKSSWINSNAHTTLMVFYRRRSFWIFRNDRWHLPKGKEIVRFSSFVSLLNSRILCRHDYRGVWGFKALYIVFLWVSEYSLCSCVIITHIIAMRLKFYEVQDSLSTCWEKESTQFISTRKVHIVVSDFCDFVWKMYSTFSIYLPLM